MFSQTPQAIIKKLEIQLKETDKFRKELVQNINQEKWTIYKDELKSVGLPSSNYQEHTAFFFEYSEEHEQSKWVAHIIAPEVQQLGSSRTNDFRKDPTVKTGTAVQEDYFNYYPDKREEDQYEGFGYDRGHLAPSADFRWYGKAISESYYYSNISPQHPDLNRKKWAKLESALRRYVIQKKVPLAIITAPVLTDDLDKIAQSPNGVTIPKFFLKIAFDYTNNRAIGFLMGNNKLSKPVDNYAISIKELEEISGMEFFPNMDKSLKSSYDVTEWFSEYDEGTVMPIKQNTLPRGYYNTSSVVRQMNKYRKVIVCGKVVSTRNSRKGNAWINLDRKYPNDYFSMMIYKDELINFTYDPVKYLIDKDVCVQGEVGEIGNKPVMNVSIEESIIVKK